MDVAYTKLCRGLLDLNVAQKGFWNANGYNISQHLARLPSHRWATCVLAWTTPGPRDSARPPNSWDQKSTRWADAAKQRCESHLDDFIYFCQLWTDFLCTYHCFLIRSFCFAQRQWSVCVPCPSVTDARLLQQPASLRSTDLYTENIYKSMTFNFESLFVALWCFHQARIGQRNGMILCTSGICVWITGPVPEQFLPVREVYDSILEICFLVWIVSLDLSKAFDKVKWENLWKPSAKMECPITCCGFCNVCIMARQGGLETIVLMEVGFVSGEACDKDVYWVLGCFRVFWK